VQRAAKLEIWQRKEFRSVIRFLREQLNFPSKFKKKTINRAVGRVKVIVSGNGAEFANFKKSMAMIAPFSARHVVSGCESRRSGGTYFGKPTTHNSRFIR
jgi:hypothetical protein